MVTGQRVAAGGTGAFKPATNLAMRKEDRACRVVVFALTRILALVWRCRFLNGSTERPGGKATPIFRLPWFAVFEKIPPHALRWRRNPSSVPLW